MIPTRVPTTARSQPAWRMCGRIGGIDRVSRDERWSAVAELMVDLGHNMAPRRDRRGGRRLAIGAGNPGEIDIRVVGQPLESGERDFGSTAARKRDRALETTEMLSPLRERSPTRPIRHVPQHLLVVMHGTRDYPRSGHDIPLVFGPSPSSTCVTTPRSLPTRYRPSSPKGMTVEREAALDSGGPGSVSHAGVMPLPRTIAVDAGPHYRARDRSDRVAEHWPYTITTHAGGNREPFHSDCSRPGRLLCQKAGASSSDDFKVGSTIGLQWISTRPQPGVFDIRYNLPDSPESAVACARIFPNERNPINCPYLTLTARAKRRRVAAPQAGADHTWTNGLGVE